MAKSAGAGELRTLVYFKKIVREADDEGYDADREVNIFGVDETGADVPMKVKWTNAHGYEVYEGMQLKLREPATILARFSPLINQKLVVYKKGDVEPWEIISVDDVENRHKWLEIKVQRKESAR